MPLTTYQIISLIVMGIMLAEMLFQLTLMCISKRKNLHAIFCAAFLSLAFVLGFNPSFGMLQSMWPGGYNFGIVKYFLFAAVNIFVLSVNFIFAIMPKFRKVNRKILYMLCTTVLVVCILYCVTDDIYHDAIVAVISGVQLVYIMYVMLHLVKAFNKKIVASAFLPALFVFYIIFIIWTAYHALQNRSEIFTHFFIGAAFPVILSFIGGFRQYVSFMKVRETASTVTPEVAQRIEQLEYANTSKDKFFSIIAHDLKSPISSIKTISEIYSNDAAESKDPHAIDLSVALRDSIDSLCALLDDLLNWARSQTGAMQFMPSYIDIGTLVDNVKMIVKPICSTKNIVLKVSIKERDKLYGDAKMLQTLLRNLITNAIKYSYNDSCIMLDFDAEGFYSVIKVTDNGIGMNKDEINNLFQIDKMSSRPGTNKEAGNGLGLIVCHEFVQKHGGTITVEAEEDLGTTFVVKIPFARYMNK